MKYSEELQGTQAREGALAGAWRVYSPVAASLGARGRNSIIWKNYHTKSIRDGVKIAEEVNPLDPYENAGAAILKQAARRTVEVAGDGTSVSIILGFALAQEGHKLVTSGIDPIAIRGAIEKGAGLLIEEIKRLSRPVTTLAQKIEVATVSAQSEKLGTLVGETLDKAGADGIVTVESALGGETFVEHEEGMEFNSGFRDQIFITNPANMTATVSNARILVTDKRLNNLYDLVPLINNVCNPSSQDNPNGHNHKNLVVIAEEIEGNVLATLAGNKYKGTLNVLAVKAPHYKKQDTLRDIAILTGAKFISEATDDLTQVTFEDLGTAKRVTASATATQIVEGGGSLEAIKARIEAIESQITDEKNSFNKQKLRERLAKLTGGVFVVYAGGATEIEIEDKKERLDDAIQATRAALRAGIVPGGETIYQHIATVLKPQTVDEEAAYRLLRSAITLPFTRLVENAGLNAGKLAAQLEAQKFGMGIDVRTGEIVNLIKSGIIDPSLVPQQAITNAVSAAMQFLVSDGIIVQKEEKEK